MFTQVLSGHYFKGLLFQYDDEIDNFIEPPKEVRFKPHDTSQRDIGSGIREDKASQELQGFPIATYSMVIQVVENFKYTIGDKFQDLTDGKVYTIKKIGRGYDSINAITNLMFPNIDNRPKILYLGDISE